jgi:hypothetical protein
MNEKSDKPRTTMDFEKDPADVSKDLILIRPAAVMTKIKGMLKMNAYIPPSNIQRAKSEKISGIVRRSWGLKMRYRSHGIC